MKDSDKKTDLSVDELLALKQAKSRLETIMDSTLDVIVITDSAGYLVSVNKYFIELLDYKKDEVIGKHVSTFGPTVNTTYKCSTGESVHISETYFEDMRKLYERFVEEKKTTNWQSYFVSKQDILIPVEQNMSFFYDEQENVAGALAIIRDITGRRRAVNELQEAKHYLELIFQTSIDGIIVEDSEGYISMVNDAAGDMFGYSKDELLGKTTSLLGPVGEEYAKERRGFLKKLFDEGFVRGAERIGKKKNGSLIYLEINTVLLNDTVGNYLGRVASYRDITARRQAEEKLRESRDYLENIIESSLDSIVVTDEKGYLTTTNNAFLRLCGFSKAEVVGKHISKFSPMNEGTYESTTGELIEINEGFANYIKSMMGEFVEKKQLSNRTTYYLRKDSKIVPVEDNMVFLVDKKGMKIGAVAIIRDITEREKAQKEILETNEFLQTTFKSSVDGIVMIDPQGNITMVNDSLLTMFGYLQDELVGKNITILKKKLDKLKTTLYFSVQLYVFIYFYLIFFNYTSFKKVAETLARNHVKKLREERLMSKAELARIAGISPLTVNRIEKGGDCRMDTKRKIILALGLKLSEKSKVFAE